MAKKNQKKARKRAKTKKTVCKEGYKVTKKGRCIKDKKYKRKLITLVQSEIKFRPVVTPKRVSFQVPLATVMHKPIHRIPTPYPKSIPKQLSSFPKKLSSLFQKAPAKPPTLNPKAPSIFRKTIKPITRLIKNVCTKIKTPTKERVKQRQVHAEKKFLSRMKKAR